MKPLTLASLSLMVASPAFASSAITGQWLTEDRKGIVEIYACGPNMCGKIKKLTVAVKGPVLDSNNSDPKLRNRPIVGLPILSNLKAAGTQWEGSIYSPERGRSFKSIVKRNPDGTLSVKGCQGPFCQTQKWTMTR